MRNDEARKNRIMEYVLKTAMASGFSRVTVEDIARGVGMGKGTLYALFPSKQALLLSSIDYFEAKMTAMLESILTDEGLSATDKLNTFLKAVAHQLSFINPAALADIERNMPEAYEKIERARQKILTTKLVSLFQDGKRNGIYNTSMDERLVAQILIGAVRHITQAQVIATLDYTFDRLFGSILSILLKGCLTEENRHLVL
ncbi:MAG: TetR/AcrR family transcriptional regulator [Clostridia bacterium]|nr:TetR/AcrR family transcriptional regulator [Clostridia bacterium]